MPSAIGSAWHGPFMLPGQHPRVGLPALRAFYAVERRDAAAAALLAKGLIVGYFQHGLDTDDATAVAGVAAEFGVEPVSLLAEIVDPEIKVIARQHGEQAVARGVFGSPWLFIDDEPFWGSLRHGRTMVNTRSMVTAVPELSDLETGLHNRGRRQHGAPARPRSLKPYRQRVARKGPAGSHIISIQEERHDGT
jgi:hypothetical protein